ncbi:hypothetical protein KR51_00032420 [Rubidibacter lacunae KORDI 51-2]|uniref:Type II secretion system protein GspC N-terminal domain-containing protein n=1 Tax=Rubidibacter lacunae KORDI 51-2 TaxID=582515 RepID=U5DFB6_9CHRO|nr:hypothetical protein [Rubidibacter lacunae]ERN40296.1 hypothetical protein KR51_00032420 [Rubidibacter lacunae KORDI 51-2]
MSQQHGRHYTKPSDTVPDAGNGRVLEIEADALMDGLFSSIDRVLGGEPQSQSEGERDISSVDGSAIVARAELHALLHDYVRAVRPEMPPEPAPAKAPAAAAPPAPARSNRLLFAAASAALVAVALGWTPIRGRIAPVTETPEVVPAEPMPIADVSEAEFADYVRRALDAIAYREEARVAAAEAAVRREREAAGETAAVEAAVTSPAIASSATSASARPVTATPSPARPRSPERTLAIAPPPVDLPPPPPLPLLPAPSTSAVVAAPPALTQATPGSATPVTTAAAPSVARVHTVVGLLELGSESAALLDVAGNTQQFLVGEAIGASGWRLLSVDARRATIQRGGQLRSIAVGDSFE